jgi:replicative DNA helicase
MALHHPRKAPSEGRGYLTLDDMYGSTWLTAGAGSVIALNGIAGTGVAKMNHLKMPSEQVGPLEIDIDYPTGRVTTIGFRDLLKRIQDQDFVTTREATQYMTGKDSPTETEKKRTRRKLDRLHKDGEISKSGNEGQMTVWSPIDSTPTFDLEGGI